MAKIRTAWKTQSGSDTVTAENEGFFLLLQTGDNLLLETGGDIYLEDSVVTPKVPITWTIPTKQRTSWEARDGSSSVETGVSEDRITESGDSRITETGDQRISEDAEFSQKLPTSWRDE